MRHPSPPEQIAPWVPPPTSLSGPTASDAAKPDPHCGAASKSMPTTFAALSTLYREGTVKKKTITDAVKILDIDPEKLSPFMA